MIFEEMLRDEKLEAKQESILELLEDLGEISKELQEKIESLEDLGKLKALLKIAAKSASINSFEEKAEAYLRSKEIK